MIRRTMNHRSADLFAVVAITLVAVALAFLVPANNVAGRIWTLPLVLLLPGYALTSALFARQSPGIVERLVFSLGLSLAIVVLGGLALNWTLFGLRASSWAVFLGGITVGASAVALVRRRGQSGPASGWLRIGRVDFSFRQGLLLGLAALIVCGAVTISIIGAERQPRLGFTQIWILPASGANARDGVRLGVSNMESKEMGYRLDVNVDGRVVKEWPSIDLNPNDKWEATLVLPQTGHASATKVEVLLYRADAPTTVYRHVILWLGT